MNKAITHGLIAGLATVIIGCFDNRCAYEETGELRFRALLELNSRGETGNTCTYPTDIPFGIWALVTGEQNVEQSRRRGANVPRRLPCDLERGDMDYRHDTQLASRPESYIFRLFSLSIPRHIFDRTGNRVQKLQHGCGLNRFDVLRTDRRSGLEKLGRDGTDTLHAGLMHGGLPGADPGAIGYDHPVEKDCPGRGGFQRELPIPAGSDMERNGRHGGSGLLRRESALGRIGTTGRRNATHDATTNTGNRESDMRHRDERQHARRTRTGNRCHSGVGHRKTL